MAMREKNDTNYSMHKQRQPLSPLSVGRQPKRGTPRPCARLRCTFHLLFVACIFTAVALCSGGGGRMAVVEAAATTAAFAAPKKTSGGAAATASSKKGFGAPPPTFDQVIAKFKTRQPADPTAVKCPCGSSQGEESLTYQQCCYKYHAGDAYPETPVQLLQSRYSAFCFRNIRYIIDTTHKQCADYREDRIAWAKDLNKGGMFDLYEFFRLDHDSTAEINDKDDEAFLEFEATFRAKKSAGKEEPKQITISERSRFLRNEEGRWAYAEGRVSRKS